MPPIICLRCQITQFWMYGFNVRYPLGQASLAGARSGHVWVISHGTLPSHSHQAWSALQRWHQRVSDSEVRLFLSSSTATIFLAVSTTKGRRWNGLLVARFDCISCVGRGSFAEGRRALFCKLIRDSSDVGVSDPLRMEFETRSPSVAFRAQTATATGWPHWQCCGAWHTQPLSCRCISTCHMEAWILAYTIDVRDCWSSLAAGIIISLSMPAWMTSSGWNPRKPACASMMA
jgi:hypothetical protein